MFERKKAILLIHGFVGGNYDYENLPNELQLYRNFDVFTFTLPGHEKTVVKGVKYQEWLDASVEKIKFLIENNYKEIYLIGHSMGGVIATYLASKYTEVKKLVLVAPAFRYFYFKDGKINIKNITSTIKNVPDLFKNMGREKVVERIKKTPVATMLEFTKLVDTCQSSIKKVTCPVLIIHGMNDKVAPIESTNLVHEKISSKSTTLVNIKDTTHDCFYGKRSIEIKKIIIDFLKERPIEKKETLNI